MVLVKCWGNPATGWTVATNWIEIRIKQIVRFRKNKKSINIKIVNSLLRKDCLDWRYEPIYFIPNLKNRNKNKERETIVSKRLKNY